MENYTIKENFTLPSRGLIYERAIEPGVTLRSMTTREEMLRLAPAKPGEQYKVMAEIIDNCLLKGTGMSSYDMCVGDYQFLLYMLRVVTYGPEYKLVLECPNCHHVVEVTLNLESDLQLATLDDFNHDELTVELPRTKKTVKMRVQTPRMLDRVEELCENFKKRLATASGLEGWEKFQDPHIKYQLMTMIESVDGERIPEARLEGFVDNLPMSDANILLQRMDEVNSKVGYGAFTKVKCPDCDFEMVTPFRITSEFFRPSVD